MRLALASGWLKGGSPSPHAAAATSSPHTGLCALDHTFMRYTLNFELCVCTVQGYGFYITILYIVASVLIVSLGLCVWVGWCFKNQRFTVVW